MADRPFDDEADDLPRADPTEGVRLIKADEAAEAVERGDAVKRRGSDEPRYGDRPDPPDGPRPSLRFPLDDTADPSLVVRPRVAPVDAPPLDLTAESASPPERPSAPAPVSPPPAATPAPPTAAAPPPPPADPRGAGDDAPISLPISGSVELPHWTEPGTGEVPKVIVGEDEEAARWSAFVDQGPRWRDQPDDWDAGDAGVADLIGQDEVEEPPLGALDVTVRPTDEEFLTFDDLEVPQQQPPTAPTRGSVDDPIRISSDPARAPARGQDPTRGERPAASPRAPRRTGATTGGAPRSGPPRSPADGTPPGGRDVLTAVYVGLGLAAVALIAFHFGPAWAMVLVVAAIALCGAEFFTAVRRAGYRPATLLGLAAVGALPLAAYWRGEAAVPLVLFLVTTFGFVWFIAGLGPDVTVNLSVTLFGTLYVGMFGAFAALILRIPSQGVSILLVAVIAAVFYDVGGFAVGSRLGRRPLSAVSPNKTVEGLVAGIVASFVAVIVTTEVFGFGPFSFSHALVFALFCAVAAPIGDLSESLIKRDLGIKDMGSLLPAHGGVLDRFDALLLVLPTAYALARALKLY